MTKRRLLTGICCFSLLLSVSQANVEAQPKRKLFGTKSFQLFSHSPHAKMTPLTPSNGIEDSAEVFISVEPAFIPLNSMENLRKRWTYMFVESLAINYLDVATDDSFFYLNIYSDEKILAPSYVAVQLCCKLNEEKAFVEYFLNMIENFKQNGPAAQEWEEMKSEALSDIAEIVKIIQAGQTDDDIEALRAEYQDESSFISFEEFMSFSYECVNSLSLEDIQLATLEYFAPENREVERFVANDFFNTEKEEVLEEEDIDDEEDRGFDALQHSQRSYARSFDILKEGYAEGEEAAQENSTEPFYNLPISESEKRIVRKIITTMADKNVFQLLLDKKTLEKKGKKIRHIHPLRFIGFICSDHHLRKCLHTISKNHFKWSSFIDGFSDRMKEESRKGLLLPFVPGFAQQVGKDPATITNYINKGDYEGLVSFLI